MTSVSSNPLQSRLSSAVTPNSDLLATTGFEMPRKRHIQKLWDVCCNGTNRFNTEIASHNSVKHFFSSNKTGILTLLGV